MIETQGIVLGEDETIISRRFLRHLLREERKKGYDQGYVKGLSDGYHLAEADCKERSSTWDVKKEAAKN